ncbi:hypothetical protein GYMLUDRAFT_246542 [Collybiopsis luxurians FD-317 M1]|uniref:Uncharacterized protein n=1 Tax=Collybiopsis luxurians FD-317 M1 TaxID=944289 RepID=A0A0D0B3Q1_9AGAR|nr:hypothetical protein GYMLUDRAFT_246542 [Collybiopsis luxurians FD-317 M1]
MKEVVNEFMDWVKGLSHSQVQGMNLKLQAFILSSIIHCFSNMGAESWALTELSTNLNEAQHAWTNCFTGTDLSLLKAILSAKTLDFNTSEEMALSLCSSALKNPQNSHFNWTRRQLNCESNKANKRKAHKNQNQVVADLCQQTADAKATAKELQSKLWDVTSSKPRAKKSIAESSSSGRVAPIHELKAQVQSITDPYPAIATAQTQSSLPQPLQTPAQEPFSAPHKLSFFLLVLEIHLKQSELFNYTQSEPANPPQQSYADMWELMQHPQSAHGSSTDFTLLHM